MERDTTIPVVTLIGADTITIERFHPYQEHGARVSDLLDGNVAYTIIGKADTTTIGAYELYIAQPIRQGTPGLQANRLVVDDTTPPVLTLNGKLIDTITANGSFYESG